MSFLKVVVPSLGFYFCSLITHCSLFTFLIPQHHLTSSLYPGLSDKMLAMVSVFLPGSRMKDMVITVSVEVVQEQKVGWLVDDQYFRGSPEKR